MFRAVCVTPVFSTLQEQRSPEQIEPMNYQAIERACHDSEAIAEGVNTYQGQIAHPAVAESQGRAWKLLSALL